MIPVEQTEFYDGTDESRGDCLRACIASMLELAPEEVPNFAAMGDMWWIEWNNFLNERGWVLGNAFWSVDDEDRTKLTGWVEGYWLAGVKSLRQRPDGTHVNHMVVMLNGEIAWDPHPAREQGHLGFIDGYTLRPYDPGKFMLKP